MMWQLRRLILGDRRKTDRVVNEAKNALRRLDQALSNFTVPHEHDRQAGNDER